MDFLRPPLERVMILDRDGATLPLGVDSRRIEMSDEDLPLRVLWAGRGDLRATPKTPGLLVRASVQQVQGAIEYLWNPFLRPKDKGERWRGEVSYGTVAGEFIAENITITIVLLITPSSLTQAQLDTMRAALATIADELIMPSTGQTRSDVGISAAYPRSWKHCQSQIERFVGPILPLMRRLGRGPRSTMLRRRPQRADVQRPQGRQRPSIASIENEFVAYCVVAWARALFMCAATAHEQAERYRRLARRLLPPGVEPADGLTRKEWKAAASEHDDLAERAMELRATLLEAVPWAKGLCRGAVPIRMTPIHVCLLNRES